jgi:hypothetical protein
MLLIMHIAPEGLGATPVTIHHVRETSPPNRSTACPEALNTAAGPKCSETETVMLQSDDVGCAPLPDFEARTALLRLNRGSAAEVTTADAFPGWMRPLNACGVEAGSVKIQRKSADHGYFEHGVERSDRDVRSDGADHCLADRYLIVSQVAGQSAMTQIDRVVHLSVGDVAFVDAARPVDISLPSMRISRRGPTSGTAFRRLRTPRKTTVTVLRAPGSEKVCAWHAASNFGGPRQD